MLTALELRRKVPLEKVHGITVSLHKESKEFVIHILEDEDLRLKTDK